MKETIYKVELGLLLPPTHDEFEHYSTAYDHKHGYYDTNVVLLLKLEQAVVQAKWFVHKPIKNAYAVVTKVELDLTKEELHDVKTYAFYDGFNACDFPECFKAENVLYSIRKNDDWTLTENFIQR